MLVIGGMSSVSGSVVGAALVLALSEILRRVEDANQLYGMSGLVLAILFVAIIIFRREGILGSRELDLGRLFARGGDRTTSDQRPGTEKNDYSIRGGGQV